jgi:transcriptional regulator GlxA family with amidase domain
MHRVIFYIAPHVHALDLAGPVQVFYASMEYGIPYNIVYVSEAPHQQSSSGLRLHQLQHFSEVTVQPEDIVFIAGFKVDRYMEHEHAPLYEWLYDAYATGATICSVCTGVFALADAGLLDGKDCTTHWQQVRRLQSSYPNVKVLDNRLFVQSGNIYTSAGIATGIDLALYLIELKHGAEFAFILSRELVVYMRRNSEDEQHSVYLQHRQHLDNTVHQVQDYIIQHLQHKITIDTLAANVFTSPRNLTRLFKAATGLTIGHYIEKLKAEQAVSLLKQQHKMSVVAARCGFKSIVQLRAIVKKHTGRLPSELPR